MIPQSSTPPPQASSPSSAPQSPSSRPTSARGVPASLADRVAVYCRQTTAANNAGVLRSVAKPTAEEMAEFLHQQLQSQQPPSIYGDVALVRVLLTDTDYDAVCRELLSLSDAIEWQCHAQPALSSVSPSPSAVDLMLQSMHVFSDDQIHAAQATVEARGLADLRRFFPVEGAAVVASGELVAEEQAVGVTVDEIDDEFPSPESDDSASGGGALSSVGSSPRDGEAEQLYNAAMELALRVDAAAEDGGYSRDVVEQHDVEGDVPVPTELVRHDRESDDITTDTQENNDSEMTEDRIEGVAVGGDESAVESLTATSDRDATERIQSEHSQPEELADSERVQDEHGDVDSKCMAVVDSVVERGDPPPAQVASIDAEPSGVAQQPTPFTDLLQPQHTEDNSIENTTPPAMDATPVPHPEVESNQSIDDQHAERSGDTLPPVTSSEPPANDTIAATDQSASVNPESEQPTQSEEEIEVTSDSSTAAPLNPEPPPIDEQPATSLSGSASVVRLVEGVESRAELTDDPDEPAIVSDATALHRRYSTRIDPTLPPVSEPATAQPPALDVETTLPVADETRAVGDVIPTVTTVHTAASFAVGDAVEVRYRGKSRYFSGRITAIDTSLGQYSILYDDGDVETHVDGSLIRAITATTPEHPLIETAPAVQLQSPVPVAMPPSVVATATSQFKMGEAIEARYRGWQRYFAAEIAAVHGNRLYDVRYADGDYESNVSEELIQRVAVVAATARFREGDLVEALYRGRTRWFPGQITGVHPGIVATYDVVYDDGDVEHGIVDHHVRSRLAAVSSACSSGSALAAIEMELATAAVSEQLKDTDASGEEEVETAATMEGPTVVANTGEPVIDQIQVCAVVFPTAVSTAPVRRFRAGDRVRVGVHCGWIVGLSVDEDNEAYDVLFDGVDGVSVGHKETNVDSQRIERVERETPRKEPMTKRDEQPEEPTDAAPTHEDTGNNQQPAEVELTPVVPFRRRPSSRSPSIGPLPTVPATAMNNPSTDKPVTKPDSRIHDASNDSILVRSVTTPRSTARPTTPSTPRARTAKPKTATLSVDNSPQLSDATMKYLTPQPPKRATATTNRPRTPSSTAKIKSKQPAATPSWKELEEWKNVDLILSRKRRINGQVGGSDVPWGEEFAAIQSLKRFAAQYPDVLRDHIQSQLQQVVESSTASRPMTVGATSAARDALLLVKDLAFLLRQRISPFLDTILPVALPAVFHSEKRFLCDTAYEVLEALVTHCSSRKLVVALLKQALTFPRDDLRVVNLTCLYVEKCLAVLSFAQVQEAMDRHAATVLSAVAELLTCKSAPCQSSLQKSLLLIQHVVGEDELLRLVDNCLCGNARAIVQRHLLLAENANTGGSKSPSKSPKKSAQQGETPSKSSGGDGSMSILQRMLAQRQNRVVPAPE